MILSTKLVKVVLNINNKNKLSNLMINMPS